MKTCWGKKTKTPKALYLPVHIRKMIEANVLRLRRSIVGVVNYREELENTTQSKISGNCH